jgi:hypothetical protein
LPRRIFTSPQLKTLEDCYHLAHRFFDNERSFVCPGCRETFTSKGLISLDYSAKKYTPASYGSEHYGHTFTFGITPSFDIAPKDHYICVLHFLLRLTVVQCGSGL